MLVEESTTNSFVRALQAAGLRAGDTVWVQVSLHGVANEDTAARIEASKHLLSAFMDILGSSGTLLVPAFTLSFDRGVEFDPHCSPAACGPWTGMVEFVELVRRQPGAIRSADPLFSVVSLGHAARDLCSGLPNTSFGRGSVCDRLYGCGAKLCLIGVDLQDSLVVPFVEEAAAVPWRYKKLFTGRMREGQSARKAGWIASVENGSLLREAAAARSNAAANARSEMQPASVGEDWIYVGDLRRVCDALRASLTAEAEHLRKALPSSDPATSVELPKDATMREMISALWRIPRDIVSDGYDAALHALSTQIPIGIHEYPTGTECWTWLVPENWACRDARLETMDGTVVFSYRDNPLHVVSYSLPIDKIVTREQLGSHLHTHPLLSDAIPFIFKYYERDWGLCCSKDLKDSLTDDTYRVVIDSTFSYGSLKVGECVARGSSEQTFVLCAHLCHTAMVNDDLSGVVVGIEVMRALLKRKDLRYTYRLLVLPETIGSVAYLSHHGDLVPKMAGGLFLEMLGLDKPHALQLSFAGDTEVDRCLTGVLHESDPEAWVGAFRTVVGNDERQFNAPGVRVPMLSLSRVARESTNGWPYYPEYHSSHDTPELASDARLAESRDLVLRMIDAFESNEIPVPLFQGEVFCSRYGLHIDAYERPEENQALFDVIFLIDGARSVAEIAKRCGTSVGVVRNVLEELRARGLITYAPASVK